MSGGYAALVGIDWRRTQAEAMELACLTMRRQHAEEAIATGVERVWSGKPPWKVGGESLVSFVVRIGRRWFDTERRRERRQQSVSVAEPETAAESPESLYEAQERKARLQAKLVEACQDPHERALLEVAGEGFGSIQAQMDRFGVTEREARAVRRRVRRKLEAILLEENAAHP